MPPPAAQRIFCRRRQRSAYSAAADFVQNGVTDESWANYIAKFDSIGVPKYIEEYQRALDASGLLED